MTETQLAAIIHALKDAEVTARAVATCAANAVLALYACAVLLLVLVVVVVVKL